MSTGLSAAQMKNLALAWHCMESEPKIDWDRFATLSGLKNAASARETLRQAKKKLFELAPVDGAETGTTAKTATKTPKSAKKTSGSTAKGRAKGGRGVKKVDSEDKADELIAATPSKGTKRGRGVSVKVEDEDEDATGVTDDEGVAGAEKRVKVEETAGGAEISVEGFEGMQREFDE
ncbi:hypothetical protein MBLNU457_3164t1 [Dothideomycetes sp. NU457]